MTKSDQTSSVGGTVLTRP